MTGSHQLGVISRLVPACGLDAGPGRATGAAFQPLRQGPKWHVRRDATVDQLLGVERGAMATALTPNELKGPILDRIADRRPRPSGAPGCFFASHDHFLIITAERIENNWGGFDGLQRATSDEGVKSPMQFNHLGEVRFARGV
jgi:hypothetical protein